MKYKSLKLEKFNNFSLGNKDFQVLNLLYKPILLSDSINVYTTLYELSYLYENEVKTLSIIDSLGVNEVKEEEFFDSLNLLQLLKLIKVENNVITLYKPLTTKEFFKCELASYLKANTSEEYFNDLTRTFNISNNVSYPANYSLNDLSLSLNYPREDKKINDDVLSYIKAHKAYDIISSTNSFMSISDKNTIERIKNELNVSDELLSLLIIYSLVTNNNKLHQFKYYETIILDWRSKDIVSVDDAYNYINSLYNKKNSKSKSSEEWFNDYWGKIKEENK